MIEACYLLIEAGYWGPQGPATTGQERCLLIWSTYKTPDAYWITILLFGCALGLATYACR